MAEHEKNKIMHKLGTMAAVEARTAWLDTLLATQICTGNGWLGGYVQVGDKEASRSCVPQGRVFVILSTLEWPSGARLLHCAPPPPLLRPPFVIRRCLKMCLQESRFNAISNEITTINQ